MRKLISFASMILGTWLVVPATVQAQFNFGYVPVGTTNTATGFQFNGGSWDGTNVVMTVESFLVSCITHNFG
jgi:hypothetical protein